MSDVMDQTRESNVVALLDRKTEAILRGVNNSVHDSEHAEAVCKARVCCIRVGHVSHTQLFQVSKTLKRNGIDDAFFSRRKLDITVNNIRDDRPSGC